MRVIRAAPGSHWTMNVWQPLCMPSLLMIRVDYCNVVNAMSPQTIGCKGPGDEHGSSGWQWHLYNMTVDWRQYCKTSSTGWMSLRGLNTSLVWWCTGVHMTEHLRTSLITSSQPLMLLLAVFVYDPLTWIVSLFLTADFAHMAVGLFIMLAQQFETRCQMNLEILALLMALNDSWKQFFSAVTTATSALL